MMSVQSSLSHASDQRLRLRGAEAEISAEARDRRVDRLLGLTEPDAGSGSGSMKTRATKIDGGYRLMARRPITNAPIADAFAVWAKSESARAADPRFVLEKGTKVFAPEDRGQAPARFG